MNALLLLLLSASAVLCHDPIAKAERLLERLDLKNYDDFASEREKTSTDSTDSSDAGRIARAVEAALEAAELAQPAAARAEPEFSTFQLRLSTTNAAGRCAGIACANVRRATADSDIEGATALVDTTDGQFVATFGALGEPANVARHVNDQFQFTVTYANRADGTDDVFTLETVTGEFGLNITSITIGSQVGANVPAAGIAYFRVAESSDFDDETLLTDDETLRAIPDDSEIGCDITFDGPNSQLVGSAAFTVVGEGVRNLIVADRALTITPPEGDPINDGNPININQQQQFGGNLFLVATTDFTNVGFASQPCTTRDRVVYEGIAIVTKREGETANTQDTLLHPLIYDSLQSTVASTPPRFDSFLNELRQAAGRTQLRLRDITLDTGAFSTFSHGSKFTPCFRVFPDDDYLVEVYIGMRGATGEVVRAQLRDGQFGNDLVQNGEVVFDADAPPQFRTRELVFADLDNDDEPNAARPFEELPSDVTVTLEECQEFSYFA